MQIPWGCWDLGALCPRWEREPQTSLCRSVGGSGQSQAVLSGHFLDDFLMQDRISENFISLHTLLALLRFYCFPEFPSCLQLNQFGAPMELLKFPPKLFQSWAAAPEGLCCPRGALLAVIPSFGISFTFPPSSGIKLCQLQG